MRRHFVTHPKFQISFTLAFMLGTVLTILVLGGTSYSILTLLANDPTINGDTKSILLNGANTLLMQIGLSTVSGIIIFGIIGFYLSHKFVGPLNRLEQWLEQFKSGSEINPFTARPSDELEPTTRLLNEILVKKGKN